MHFWWQLIVNGHYNFQSSRCRLKYTISQKYKHNEYFNTLPPYNFDHIIPVLDFLNLTPDPVKSLPKLLQIQKLIKLVPVIQLMLFLTGIKIYVWNWTNPIYKNEENIEISFVSSGLITINIWTQETSKI